MPSSSLATTRRSLEFKTFALVFLLLVDVCSASMSPHFRRFVRKNYGAALERELNRADLGAGGSFGGGRHRARTPTENRPVLLVHGITNRAATFDGIRKYFLHHDYTDAEVYGTTYGDAGKTNVVFVTMNCHYSKMIRALIQTVADYTSSKVNILAYSMGSPVARKAILGGACVDTGEQLGPPLTDLVHTFVGVAGANFGSFLCVFPVGSCNLINGMACGSRHLNDINSKRGYEGARTYTIASTGDEKVGFMACGRKASEIPGQTQMFTKTGMNHDHVMFDTVGLQYNLVTHGRP
ncbi:Lipase EstA/Esterase EstB family-containing protein [Aphelenchoides fujianensis]|nr:Lipase EstA/Esterase EstB family-containing protein [Aphelenchoides fujianensis]